MTELRWGIIGPGRIADHFAAAISRCSTSRLVAVGARDPKRDDYGGRFPGARVLEGYDAVLLDPDVDVVYIATPHPFHAHWGIRAAEAGKHVLCEKPIGVNRAEAEAMFRAARSAGTFMGEAFMYRFHPLTRKLVDVVRDGAVGPPRFIKSSFGFAQRRTAENERLFAHELGGGGILDLGVYPVSMVRLLAGVDTEARFTDPELVSATGHIGDTNVDEYACAVLQFPGDLVAEVSCSISGELDNTLRVFGTSGRIEVKEFWFGGGFDGGTAYINVFPSQGDPTSIPVGDEGRGLYDFEVDAVARAIANGSSEFTSPGMSWSDTLGNMQTADRWRSAIGLRYSFENNT